MGSLKIDTERMLKYKTFAMAFSYPDEDFFAFFPKLCDEKEKLILEYDRLFRISEIWLYGTEHLVKNEFQRSNNLSDIMGFYRAFGLEPNKDRPDSVSGELEFMHYLIFKRLRAFKRKNTLKENEKTLICLDAQRKFFKEHLYPALKKIAEAVILKAEHSFYIEIACEILDFLEKEKQSLGVNV